MAWRKGMLAVCMRGAPWHDVRGTADTSGPLKGDVLRVRGVHHFRPPWWRLWESGFVGLEFEEWRGTAFNSRSFRLAQHSGMQTLRSICTDPTREIPARVREKA